MGYVLVGFVYAVYARHDNAPDCDRLVMVTVWCRWSVSGARCGAGGEYAAYACNSCARWVSARQCVRRRWVIRYVDDATGFAARARARRDLCGYGRDSHDVRVCDGYVSYSHDVQLCDSTSICGAGAMRYACLVMVHAAGMGMVSGMVGLYAVTGV